MPYFLALIALVLVLFGCDAVVVDDEVPERGPELSVPPGVPRGEWPLRARPLESVKAIPTPVGAAYCEIVVEGVARPTETDYLPHVIQCENGGANFEALKAQAIAARSVAYYAMANDGQICDGQGCQVYSCGVQPQKIHYDAVAATAGQYLSFNGWLTYAFYVAGDPQQPASCVDTDNANVAGTEQFVTFNEGKTLYEVDQTKLGFIFPEDVNTTGYGQNRGCMSQWGGRCLENTKGFDSEKILRFYYGADIEILQALGPCVVPPNQPAAGALEGAECAGGIAGWAWDPDHKDTPINTYLSFLAPLGEPNAAPFTVLADEFRDDLCMEIGACEHGLTLGLPRSLLDGAEHPVFGYGIDADEGLQTELPGSPQVFSCPPPALPGGVRRLVSEPEALAGWQFSRFWQVAKVDAATLATLPEWKAIGPVPTLIQVPGEPTLWLVDGALRRLVPSPEVAAAWRFDPEAAMSISADALAALPEGTPVRPEPFLVEGEGPAVFLIDDPQCPAGGDPEDPLCPKGEGSSSGAEDPGSSGEPLTGGTLGSGGSEGGGISEGGESASGGALPPGYGETGSEAGCGCRSEVVQGPGLLGLVVCMMGRRRRPRRSARR